MHETTVKAAQPVCATASLREGSGLGPINEFSACWSAAVCLCPVVGATSRPFGRRRPDRPMDSGSHLAVLTNTVDRQMMPSLRACS
jgi:hypothetical protein